MESVFWPVPWRMFIMASYPCSPAMMFGTAALNVAFVAHGDPKLWAWYIGVFPIASKLAMTAGQYMATRLIVRARISAARAPAV